MAKLILRDLNGLTDLNEVMQAITALAEICVQQAQSCLMQALQAQFGAPLGESSATPQELLIIGNGQAGRRRIGMFRQISI